MNKVSPQLLRLRRLARALPQGAPRRAGGLSGDFSSLIRAALAGPDRRVVMQLADIMLLNSASRLGDLESPSRAASPFSPARPWRNGASLAPLLANLKPPQRPLRPLRPGSTLPPEWLSPPPPAKIPPQSASRRQEFDALIQSAAQRHGVDPNLVRAVITAESDFDPHTVSQAGAMGLMQLMPETAADLGVEDPFDPAQNIEAGTRYLAMMLERFGGDEAKALAAYNWGPSNVERGGRLPAETRTYLKRVARYRALYARGFQAKA